MAVDRPWLYGTPFQKVGAMNMFQCRCAFAPVVALLLAALPSTTRPMQAPILVQGSTFPGVDLPERESFHQVAEEFIAAAAAGDIAKMTRMISPDMVTRTGREAVERYLTDNVLPFFAQFKETGRSTTITRTADMPGFVFYMYMVSKADQLRPFVIFVIEENGAKVVANILVDKFVEGRHCTFEAGQWKCPDFR
jgi:hypothetical protein